MINGIQCGLVNSNTIKLSKHGLLVYLSTSSFKTFNFLGISTELTSHRTHRIGFQVHPVVSPQSVIEIL